MKRVLVLLLLLTACRDASDPRAVLSLVEEVDSAVAESAAPLELPGASFDWFNEGLAGLRVPILAADGYRQDVPGERSLITWELPLPTAETGGRGSAQPSLEGIDITTQIVPGLKPEEGATHGFAVAGFRLQVVVPRGEALPERFELTYPVWAAQLVGRPETDIIHSAHLFRAMRVREQAANEAIVVPGGTRLVLSLPQLGSGRLTGLLSALSAQKEAHEVTGRVRVGDEESRFTVVPGEEPVFHEQDFRGVSQGDSFELSVDGDPRDLVFFEAPALARELDAAERSARPNVLLVLIDTLRADRLRAFGGKRELAPRLDALADESLSFTQCWAGSSWTLPSIATMFTSTHGGQHLAWVDTNRLGRGVDTLAEAYRRAGYHTAGFTDGAFLSPHFGLNRGFDLWDASGGGVENVVERVEEYLARVGDAPWFAVLHTYEVHAPYEPPKEVTEEVIARHPGALHGRGPEPHRFYSLTEDGTPIPAETARALEELYDEELRFTDEVLGTFIDGLRAKGELDRTLVCVTADHGEEFGEHGLLGHGDTLYVEQLHVPLFLRFPDGRHAGEVDDRPVSAIDLAPTLLAASGLADSLEGTTFIGRPLLGGGDPSPVYAVRYHPDVGLLETLRDGHDVGIRGPFFYPAPRPSKKEWQVFDLASDPMQLDAKDGADELASRLERLSKVYRQVYVEETAVSPDAGTHLALEKLGYVGED